MKTAIAAILALGLLTGAASARTAQTVFADINSTAPKSAFDQLNASAPRSIFDDIRDSAPRSVSVFVKLQRNAP